MGPMIIGLCGLAGVGKTTTANALFELFPHKYFKTLSLAGPVKRMARDCFGWDGVKDERGRRLLQVLGTDCGRAWDENFWVNIWRHDAEYMLKHGSSIVCDDIRFQNEVDAVRDLRGVVFRLVSGDRGQHLNHASEQQDLFVDCIYEVTPTETPADVARGIMSLYEYHKTRSPR